MVADAIKRGDELWKYITPAIIEMIVAVTTELHYEQILITRPEASPSKG